MGVEADPDRIYIHCWLVFLCEFDPRNQRFYFSGKMLEVIFVMMRDRRSSHYWLYYLSYFLLVMFSEAPAISWLILTAWPACKTLRMGVKQHPGQGRAMFHIIIKWTILAIESQEDHTITYKSDWPESHAGHNIERWAYEGDNYYYE